MAFKHDELTCSIYYTSIRDAKTEEALQQITLSVMEANPQGNQEEQQRTKFVLFKSKNGEFSYSVGESFTKNASGPLLVAIGEYWRKNVLTEVPKLKTYLLDLFENNLSSVNVWQASESVCFAAGKSLSGYLPPDVLGFTVNTETELEPSIHADIYVGTDIEAAENIEIAPKLKR